MFLPPGGQRFCLTMLWASCRGLTSAVLWLTFTGLAQLRFEVPRGEGGVQWSHLVWGISLALDFPS